MNAKEAITKIRLILNESDGIFYSDERSQVEEALAFLRSSLSGVPGRSYLFEKYSAVKTDWETLCSPRKLLKVPDGIHSVRDSILSALSVIESHLVSED